MILNRKSLFATWYLAPFDVPVFLFIMFFYCSSYYHKDALALKMFCITDFRM